MIPSFQDYTGPYQVGTVDIEIPVNDLHSPAPRPANSDSIHTILVRVYYPAVNNSGESKVRWLPTPQRQNVSAYAQFMGLGPTAADVISYFPRHMYYTTIPAFKNAKIASSSSPSGRWPTAIFSHGLAGCRNSYSYIAGSLASHGIIVFSPEHRDGSAVLTMVRNPTAKVGRFTPWKNIAEMRPYIRLAHDATPEIFDARTQQLRIRLWELGLLFDAIMKMDRGEPFKNLNTSTTGLEMFKDTLDVREPGKMIWMGHSFGAATMVQFLKSVYYAESPELKSLKSPLYLPIRDSHVCRQITPKNVIILLDMWCMPLYDPNFTVLLHFPLPVYAHEIGAPGGKALLAVESEQFYKWKEHLHATCRVLSVHPDERVVQKEHQINEATNEQFAPARFFWVHESAHLNQSDFGVLFPWVTKKIFSASEPERALRLNLRAQLQVLRDNGVPIAATHLDECIDGGHDMSNAKVDNSRLADDSVIFHKEDIDAWEAIDIVGMGDESPQFGWRADGDTSEIEPDGKTLHEEERANIVESTVAPVAANVDVGT